MITYQQYISDVQSGRILTCRYITLAVERYLQDLEREDLVWDGQRAAVAIQFFQTCLVHTRGKWAGKPFTLLPWQQFVIAQLFGWYNLDGSRRFTKMYLEVARKNGKTQIGAGIGLLMLDLFGEAAAEVYFAATKKDQAKLGYDEAKRMVERSKVLRTRMDPMQYLIRCPRNNGVAKALGADRGTHDGLSVQYALVDEYHAHKNSDMYDVLVSATLARQNPLIATITTAGFNLDGPCMSMRKAAVEVLQGKAQDDSTLCLIYTLDPDDAFDDPANWIKANPSLGVIQTEERLQQEFTTAQNSGTVALHNFKTKHLNIWVHNEDPWIEDLPWMACADEDFEPPADAPCWAGLDLASVRDMTALTLMWPVGDEYLVKNWYLLPEDTVRERLAKKGSHVYGLFQDMNNVLITEGNVTDYNAFRKLVTGQHMVDGALQYDANCLAERYNIQGIAYDRHNATQFVIDLQTDGIRTVPYGQGFVSLSFPTKAIERKALAGDLRHDGDPVLRWMVGNVVLQRDPAGNVKPDKAKSSDKIDGVVSMCMAVGQYMKQQATDQKDKLPKDIGVRGF